MTKSKLFISILILLFLSFIFIFKDKMYENSIDEVYFNNSQNKEMFAIMLEDAESETGYKKSDSTEWPENGYKFNVKRSGCVDEEGKQIEDKNILTFDNKTNTAKVDTDKTVYCYLYFDKDKSICTSGISNLTQGRKYTKGQFTYSYMQDYGTGQNNKWRNLDLDGWGVKVTNLNSTEAIKPEGLCSSIDGKPIVSTAYMFDYSQAISIDLSGWNTSKVKDMNHMFNDAVTSSINISGWDTSNVTDMSCMFDSTGATEIIGYENFNTENVTDMTAMFRNSKISSIDISKWNTKNITSIQYIFQNSQAESINITGMNISKVNDISDMFRNTQVTKIIGYEDLDTSSVMDMNYVFGSTKLSTIDISKWDTSKATTMYEMFGYSAASNIILRNKDTSSLTNIGYMFRNTPNLTEIDLSGFDINNVDISEMQGMFTGTGATTGWVKDTRTVSILNAYSGKPSTLTFKVKS